MAELDEILATVRSMYTDEFQSSITKVNTIEDLKREVNFISEIIIEQKKRQKEIITHIIECCAGDFYNPIPTSSKNDELDVISSGFNIYIEELTAATVSKEALRIANEELLKEKEISEQLANAKEEFLSNVSHELRTPLNGIIGFTDILIESKNLDESQKKHLSTIKTSSDILLALVDELLDNENSNIEVLNPIDVMGTSKKIKILVAEDNAINQLLISTILNQEGFEVVVADNGKIAVDLLIEADFDIILMDLMMPEMNGYDATEYIRKNLTGVKASIPVVAVSADVTKDVKEKCKAVGMNEYISKPYDSKHLIEVIYKIVG